MKNKTIIALATLASVTLANESFAKKSYDDRLYIAPTASYLWLDDDRLSSRSGHGFSLGLGKAISENTNLEVKALYNRYQYQGNKTNKFQWDTYGAALDLQYYLWRKEVSPYFVASAGLMNSNAGNSNALGIIAEAGFGVSYKINNNISLRSDVRYRYNDNLNKSLTTGNRDRYNDAVVNVGFVIPFGSSSQEAVAPKKEIAVPVKEVTKKVNPDLDGDGVQNEYDECPNTKKGSVVDKKGCELERVTLTEVNFNSGSSNLTAEAKTALDKLVKNINEYPKKETIEIQGHTDSTGSNRLNMMISQGRAKSVATYLVDSGVSNEITSNGYGEEKPIADNSTKEGRAQNRRVDLIWR